MDHVGVVVDDLEAATAFFIELGMELEGEAPVEGRWVDRVVGLDDVRVDIAMMRTPDGHGRLELTKFHSPMAISGQLKNAPANTLGLRRIMFAVDDIDDVVARLQNPRRRARGRRGAIRGQLSLVLHPRSGRDHRRAGRAAQLTDLNRAGDPRRGRRSRRTESGPLARTRPGRVSAPRPAPHRRGCGRVSGDRDRP